MLDWTLQTIETACAEAKPLLEGVVAKYGFLPNLAAAMADTPKLLGGYLAVGKAFEESSLSPIEQQVVALTTSAFHTCEYCMAGHSMLAAHLGMSGGDLEALRAGTAMETPRLESLRQFTKLLIETRGRVIAADIDRMLAAGFTQTQIADVVLGVAFKTISNYSHALRPIPVDPQFATYAWIPPAVPRRATLLIAGWLNGGRIDELTTYQSAAGPIMKKHGGRPRLRAKPVAGLTGDKPDLVVLMEFPSAEAATAAFADPAYRELLPLRDRVFARIEISDLGETA